MFHPTRRHLLAATGLAALLPRTAMADTIAEVKKRGSVNIGIQGDNPPFGFVNAQGVQDGFDADLANGRHIIKKGDVMVCGGARSQSRVG